MKLFGLKQATVGHTAVGLWRHPECQAHRYKELGYWLETAKTLESGYFDGLFIADALGVLDTFGGTIDLPLRHGVQTPCIDPLLAISAMATVTQHLGFAVTISTTYEQPYLLARKFTTLDHLTGGRIGWNIVTSALDSAARNLGLNRQIPHDERYVRADDFLTAAYRLWEDSWDDDAVRFDREGSLFADPNKVSAVNHAGPYYRIQDAFLCEPSPQRTPVIFQAGTSRAGQEFAAKHAEAVFVSVPTPTLARRLVDSIRGLAASFGRDPRSILFLALVAIVPGRDRITAENKHAEYLRFISPEGHLARHSALFQLDLSHVDLDTPLEHVETEGIRGVLELFTGSDNGRRWTPREIGQSLGVAAGGPTFVGSPVDIVDTMLQWTQQGDLDGFNILDPMPLRSYPDFIDLVLPELQRRGLVRTKYQGGTFRENLFGPGQTHLRGDHPARKILQRGPAPA